MIRLGFTPPGISRGAFLSGEEIETPPVSAVMEAQNFGRATSGAQLCGLLFPGGKVDEDLFLSVRPSRKGFLLVEAFANEGAGLSIYGADSILEDRFWEARGWRSFVLAASGPVSLEIYFADEPFFAFRISELPDLSPDTPGALGFWGSDQGVLGGTWLGDGFENPAQTYFAPPVEGEFWLPTNSFSAVCASAEVAAVSVRLQGSIPIGSAADVLAIGSTKLELSRIATNSFRFLLRGVSLGGIYAGDGTGVFDCMIAYSPITGWRAIVNGQGGYAGDLSNPPGGSAAVSFGSGAMFDLALPWVGAFTNPAETLPERLAFSRNQQWNLYALQ